MDKDRGSASQGDEEKETEKQEEVVVAVEDKDEDEDEDEDEDVDEDDGKDPQTIGRGEMVYTSADDVETMADHEPTRLPGQSQVMHKHTPRPQLAPPDPQPQTSEPGPLQRTMMPDSLSGLEIIDPVMPHNARPVALTP